MPSNTIPVDRLKYNPGRPRKLTVSDERKIIRMVRVLRKGLGDRFTFGTLRNESGVNQVKHRTVRYYLNKNGYHFWHSRKKGRVTPKDRLNPVKFARKVLTRLTSEL